MSVGVHCDGPGCTRWAGHKSHMHGWLKLDDRLDWDKDSSLSELHFCGKTCLINHLNREKK